MKKRLVALLLAGASEPMAESAMYCYEETEAECYEEPAIEYQKEDSALWRSGYNNGLPLE